MLAQEALYTKLSLREVDLTIESLQKEKLLIETDEGILET